ncbi:MAG: putative phosphohydrolase, partial [Adhaeribacter sp.]|nr:putative phosphohydrolase [Adhaeribacter sp.]
VISSMFGSYSDKREIQACLAKPDTYDYSHLDDIWIDYMSDTGDGFHTTFTMANLLAENERVVDGQETFKGDILILGGDQVYPVATRDDYKNRFRGPFDSACRNQSERQKLRKRNLRIEKPGKEHDLFAIPGNHDWYDGLSNFIKIFCQGRTIGNWLTRQHRSYFAIKLPHNWWLWGIDIQLEADIDYPQLQYFDKIAAKQMQPGDKIILCTAEPSWVFTPYHQNKSYDNLKFFEQRYIVQNGFELVVSIAGDLHHYAHYALADEEKTLHKITSGGGGAFLHPTHNLAEELHLREGDFKLQTTFPDRKSSRNLTFWNLAFPWFNLQFAGFMGAFYLVFAWLLQEATKNNMHTFMSEVSNFALSQTGWVKYLNYLFYLLLINPFMVFFIGLVIFGVTKFTDTKSSNTRFLWLFGLAHGIIHILNGFLLIWIFSRFTYPLDIHLLFKILTLSVLLFVVGGITGCLVMSIYLLLTNLWFGIHSNEAFSAIKWTGYKNFLRLHITADALRIYPIGVRKTAKWQRTGKIYNPNREVKTILVDQVITVKSKKYEEASQSLPFLTPN